MSPEQCPYCSKAIEPHHSGLGYSCRTHGFIPDLVLHESKRDQVEPRPDYDHVPAWDRITIGTESKGRADVHIPVTASNAEAKAIIDKALARVHYARAQVEDMGMDILPNKKKE